MSSLSGLFEPITFSIRFEDVAAVSESVKQCAGEPLGAKDLRLFLEGQIGGHHEPVVFIGPADDLKE